MTKVDEMHECLSDALAAAQAEFGHILKNKMANTGKYSYAYSDIADVIAAVTPALSKHGLCQLQRFVIRDCQQLLVTELRFKQEIVSSEMLLPITGLDPQTIGKLTTYFRRYSLQSILGVAAEKDDDAADTGDVRQPEAARRAPEPEPGPDMHDVIVRADGLFEAVELAEDKEKLAEIARQMKGTFQGQPFWPWLVRYNRSMAGELQAAVRNRAATLDLDLSTV
jgi:hypothetical protein